MFTYTIYNGDVIVATGNNRESVIEEAKKKCPNTELVGVRIDSKGREAGFFVNSNNNLTVAMWG